MSATAQHLERRFKIFIDQTQTLAFFKGLAEYLDYAFEISELKNVFEKQLTERNAGYERIGELESKLLSELNDAKQKLLQILRKRAIDVKTLRRFATMTLSGDTDILEELEMYENGRIWGRRLSDSIESYLFDIASNLLGLGFRNDVAEFLVSPAEYEDYRNGVKGLKRIVIADRESACFIFSKTLPLRDEAVALTERERELGKWAPFEKLYQFKRAYEETAANRDAIASFENRPVGEFGLAEADAVEMAFLQNELQKLLLEKSRWGSGQVSERRHLIVEPFKFAAQAVHNRLMQVATGELADSQPVDYWITKERGGDYYFNRNKIHFTNPNADYVKIFVAVLSLMPQGGGIVYSQITAKCKGATKKAIQRALTGEDANFFRYISSVERTPAYGIPLFEAARNGKKLLFNNRR